jgi:hypothetical protein
MSKVIDDRAASYWEVDRQASGHVPKSYYVVILRNKKAGRSIVKASSSDSEYMNQYAQQLSEDLYTLTNDEFVNKYQLKHSA